MNKIFIKNKINKRFNLGFIRSVENDIVQNARKPKLAISFFTTGFTLTEVLIAIFIFSVAVTALLSLSGSTINSNQYAKADIVATYLAQEAIDIVRNDRDSIVFQQTNSGGTADWTGFTSKYDVCFDTSLGCEINSITREIYSCSDYDDAGNSACHVINLYRNESSTPQYDYYNIDPTGLLDKLESTNMRRKVVLYNNPLKDGVLVVVTLSWKNGEITKTKIFTETLYDWLK